MELGKAGDQRGAVERLELIEVAVVNEAGDDVARIEGHLRIGAGNPEQLIDVVARLAAGATRARSALAMVDALDDLAAKADCIHLVDREVVGEATDTRVHLRPAQTLVIALLAGCHFHQWRPAEKHLRTFLDHDDVVAHSGYVGAPGGGVTKDD